MHIDAAFDAGNIEVVDASDPENVRLRIRRDPPTDTPDGVVQFFQWFAFRVVGARHQSLVLHIEDVHEAAYPDGWPGYQACVSDGDDLWTRADTSYAENTLTIRTQADSDVLYVAYFALYPLDRVQHVVDEAAQHPDVRVAPVGTTLDGRLLHRLVVGDPSRDLPVLWVLARQHPGESMASFWMEGFLDRLLDDEDALAVALRERATLYVVPHMNPDGSVRGHLRTNAAGANLNREWADPTPTRSPEVLHVRNAMDETGVDLCLDVHGDEALPYNFIAGAAGTPGWDAHRAALQQRFEDALQQANPDFQQVHGYPVAKPGEANLRMCTAGVAERYRCVAMTLEMPFKDNADRPMPGVGWSPGRCMSLGRAAIDAMVAVVDDLRG